MYYNTIYVGMDVHKNSFTLCAYTIESEMASHFQKTEADYKKVLKYLEFLRTIYGNDTKFLCGYEAGCLGYTLYHQLSARNVDCVILAPTTMLEQRSRKRIKTDRRMQKSLLNVLHSIITVLYTFLLQRMKKPKNLFV